MPGLVGTRFLGIDFGWENKPSGVAALEWRDDQLRLLSLERLEEPRDVLQWVRQQAGVNAVAGVDAPLVIPNASGMREADKLAHTHYGRFHAGAYPASQERSFWKRTTDFSAQLRRKGFQHGDQLKPRVKGLYQIEVHPHAAVVQLFGLDRIVKYKKGTVAERATELRRLRSLMLRNFPQLQPPLRLEELPEVPEKGPALKHLEDRLDALTCAYVAAHWWFWGRERNEVLGDAKAGYIVVPKRQAGVSLAGLRESYTKAGLSEEDAAAEPLPQFERWFAEAQEAKVPEPNAMVLATVSAAGQPSARVVLLKGFDEAGFVFYTNYDSRKGRELAGNPNAALNFFWPSLERQIRITGTVARVSREQSEAYFHSRPPGSQLGAWVSRQSQVIENRNVLDAEMRQLEAKYASGPIPLPPFWGGFVLRPDAIEFWQGRPNRLHDRLVYTRSGPSAWKLQRLSP